MTEEQAEQFPGEFVSIDNKSGYCTWEYEDEYPGFAYIGGKIRSNVDAGLSSFYGPISENKDIAEVVPIDKVHGYPAVQLESDMPTDDHCDIEVGIRDDLVYSATVTLDDDHPSSDDPCEVAHKFAGIVVDNLKEEQ